MTVMQAVGGYTAPKHVIGAIQQASSQTGVDFSYLLHQAKAESSLNPAAKAKTSSATGLFQFIESTWLSMAEKHGAKYGLEGLSKSEVLAKRKDPVLASMMAAELATENQNYLKRHTKGEIGATELYFAHFLGARGASEFLNAHAETPQAEAAMLFPKAAKANKGVFFNKDGSMRSLEEVYAFFDKKLEGAKPAEQAPMIAKATPVEVKTVDTVTAQPLKTSNEAAITWSSLSAFRSFQSFDPQVKELVWSILMQGNQGLLQTPQQMRNEAGLLSLLSNFDYSQF